MQPWAWVLLIVVLVVVAVLVAALMRQRRTANLRDRFGPEYDRTIDTADDKRGAEQELLDRARRRDRLDIRALPEAARARYAEQWRAIQERFIDDPAGSVGSAHTLLDQVMAERGYPTTDFEEQADLVSVDHPRVVDNYRAAYAVYQRQSTGQATTEDLRDALVRYRSLFEDLLRPEGGGTDRRADTLEDNRAGTRADTRADTLADNRAAAGTGAGADLRARDRSDDLTDDRSDYGTDYDTDYGTDDRTGYRTDDRTGYRTDDRADDGMSGPADGTGGRRDGRLDGRADLPADEEADGGAGTRRDPGPSSTSYGERL